MHKVTKNCKRCKTQIYVHPNTLYCKKCKKIVSNEAVLRYYHKNPHKFKKWKKCFTCKKLCTGYQCKECYSKNRYGVTRMKSISNETKMLI